MAAFINQADVQRLMAQPSPHVRAVLANKLALEIERPLSDSELQIAHDIIRTLAQDAELVVRHAVSHHLRRSQHLPHDVALKLAEDVEAVALPILADSIMLTDDDLITILGRGSPVKQRAIASRPELSEKIADAVIEMADEIAVATLMGNTTAHISDSSFNKAIDRFIQNERVKESMAHRSYLPMDIAERLISIVSDKLQDHLLANHKLPPAVVSDIMKRSRERALIQLSTTTSYGEIETLVGELNDDQRLTPNLILQALCVGNLPFFEYAMATLARIPITNARTLIHDPKPEPLEALAAKAGISAPMARVMRMALTVMYELKIDGSEGDIRRFRARVIERILTQTQDLDPKDQEYLLDLIK